MSKESNSEQVKTTQESQSPNVKIPPVNTTKQYSADQSKMEKRHK